MISGKILSACAGKRVDAIDASGIIEAFRTAVVVNTVIDIFITVVPFPPDITLAHVGVDSVGTIPILARIIGAIIDVVFASSTGIAQRAAAIEHALPRKFDARSSIDARI